MKPILATALLLAFAPILCAEPLTYEKDIQPILEAKCFKCHGPEKQKSKYRLDSFEALMTTGKSEVAPVVPLDALRSQLAEFILLPRHDESAMPPEDETPLTGDEIVKIVHWIYDGARSSAAENAKVASAKSLLNEAQTTALQQLRKQGAIIQPRSEKDARLIADLQHLAVPLGADQARLLQLLAPHLDELRLTELELSATPLTWLGEFTGLANLDLSRTKLGDESVDLLNRLTALKQLNLFGTKMTNAGLARLEVPAAGQLFVGDTKINPPALTVAQAKNPARRIEGSTDLNAVITITDDALSNSATFKPLPKIPPGKQVSASGIRHSFLVCGQNTAIFNENSEVVWIGPHGTRDGMVLANGNVLVSTKTIAREYVKGGHQIVWSYELDPRNAEMGTVDRLANGNTLVIERGVLPRLLEVDAAGKIVVDVPLQPESDHGHMQTRMARKLPNGNYLVPHLLAFKVKEYTPSGEVVNTIATDLPELGGREAKNWPFTAIRLANGNTLVNLTNGNKTVEFAPDGSVAWRCDNTEVDGRFQDPCGGQRLPDGNTIICAYGQKDPEKTRIFEITRDKKVVWEFFHPDYKAHEVHILTTNGQPVAPILR